MSEAEWLFGDRTCAAGLQPSEGLNFHSRLRVFRIDLAALPARAWSRRRACRPIDRSRAIDRSKRSLLAEHRHAKPRHLDDNHLFHLYFQFIDPHVPLARINRSVRAFTAREANRVLGRTGQFWQHESYDHWSRDLRQSGRIIAYIEENPRECGISAAA